MLLAEAAVVLKLCVTRTPLPSCRNVQLTVSFDHMYQKVSPNRGSLCVLKLVVVSVLHTRHTFFTSKDCFPLDLATEMHPYHFIFASAYP